MLPVPHSGSATDTKLGLLGLIPEYVYPVDECLCIRV